MSVRITRMDFSQAISKGETARKKIRAVVTERARQDCEPFIPYQEGHLRGSGETESDPENGRIVWGNSDVPYARAQYYACPRKTFPGTCNQWFEAAKAANMSWTKTAAEAAKEIFK